ncbi:MAG: 3,4-dihydroxy-2-butanone-4-phosphate synthase [Candidatus Peribacteraceae bacterium]|jgi:3,4-dihydroxy 2-butanone 4-phosphate synthase/GTP cyclohydrolase II
MAFTPIPQALDRLREGRFLIVVDDENRENEGDVVLAAEHATGEKLAFMIRHTGGVVCLAVDNAIADRLELPPMVARNTSLHGTPFTVSIEAAEGVTTGISAQDRAATVLAAIRPDAAPEDLRRPGHVFPLRAEDGGVLVRAGHTEATVDLCRLAGLQHGGLLSELMRDDGTMMRLLDLNAFAEEHDIAMVSIADLIAWRRTRETFVRLEAESPLETETGLWSIKVFEDALHKREHVALVKGVIVPEVPTLVRVHSECLTGDVFHSRHCDCGEQLALSMERIAEEGSGAVLYLRQEGRGIGLTNKIRAYSLQQNEGLDTVQANERLGLPVDLREYGIGAQILKALGVGKIRLLTNNPKKIAGLRGYGLDVTEQVAVEITTPSQRQRLYLRAKKEKLGHLLRHL